ncbi:hypothetical protein RTP6_000118 [Batrachochytrium dendrobatidis]
MAQRLQAEQSTTEHAEGSLATVYELDIRNDYLFYSNPASREPSISDLSATIPMNPTQVMSRSGQVYDEQESATLARDGKKKGGANQKNLPPALYDPFVRKQLSKLKTHYPYFLTLMTIGQVAAVVASFILNAKTTGSPIATNPFNYMIGPTSGTLMIMGARFIPCMKQGTGFDTPNLQIACPAGIYGSINNNTYCTLLDLCQWGGFPSGHPDQWFRFFVPIMLHGGIVHILFNMSFQLQTGLQLEKDMGWWRMALIYIGSGVGGFVFGASLSDVRVPSVGASGSLYGKPSDVMNLFTKLWNPILYNLFWY